MYYLMHIRIIDLVLFLSFLNVSVGFFFRGMNNHVCEMDKAVNNQFEVLVEWINGSFFLSKGWKALCYFYGICLGAWVTLVFVVLDSSL